MRPEDILRAMNDLDQDLVAEAKRDARKPRAFRKACVLAAAILLLGGLALSAAAAAEGSGWFLRFFSSRSDRVLTADEVALIENGTVNLGQAQTHNGYTLMLESAFTDGRQSFFQFLLTAPEGTVLDGDWYGNIDNCTIRSEDGEDFFLRVGLRVADFSWRTDAVEGSANQLILIIESGSGYFTMAPQLSGRKWIIQISGLYCGYQDEELGMRTELLTDGIWTFEVTFPEDCQRQIDFIREPVEVMAALGTAARFDPDGKTLSIHEKAEPVMLTSFNIRALTAELTFVYPQIESINGDFGDIYVVMKNGEKIRMLPHYGAPNYLSYRFESPIVLEDVDHILLRDGTILRP